MQELGMDDLFKKFQAEKKNLIFSLLIHGLNVYINN